MRLIPNTAPDAQCAEDPYFAQGLVSNALTQGRHTLKGLEALQRTSHILRDADIVEAVRRGEWLLVADEVASSSASGLLPGSESSPPRAYIFEDRWPLPKVREDLVFAKSCRFQVAAARESAGRMTRAISMSGILLMARLKNMTGGEGIWESSTLLPAKRTKMLIQFGE